MNEKMMTEEESRLWRPWIEGWSDDILPFYESIVAELPNPCNVAEIGTARGRSAIFLASALLKKGHGSNSKIWCVDDWGGAWVSSLRTLVAEATDEELTLIRPVRATSEKAAGMFDGSSLDMVFVDGDHSRIGCANDLYRWHDRITGQGIFAGHDFDPDGHPGVVAAVQEFAKAYEQKITLPTRSVWRLEQL